MNFPTVLNTFFGSGLIIVLIFAECFLNYTGIKRNKRLFCYVLIIIFLSLVIDSFIFSSMPKENANFFLVSIRIIWPVIAALLLGIYLFIMLKENRIDNLTGLGNRYSFFEFFNKLSRNKTGEAWSVAMIDVNNFKMINDIYGHLEGDNALRSLAHIIKVSLKRSDFSARYGGDEFILVTKNENEMNKLITKIEYDLKKHNDTSNKLYNIEISYGIDTYIADGSRQIDVFINHIVKLMHKNNEEKRRSGDSRTGETI